MDLTQHAMQGLRNGGDSPAMKSSPADRAFRIGTMYRNCGYVGSLQVTTGRGHRLNVNAGGTEYAFDFASDEENPTIYGPRRP